MSANNAMPAAPDSYRHVEGRDGLSTRHLKVQGTVTADDISAPDIVTAGTGTPLTGVALQDNGTPVDQVKSLTFTGDVTVTNPVDGEVLVVTTPITQNLETTLGVGASAGSNNIDMATASITGFERFGNNGNQLEIGSGASATNTYTIAIGRNSTASGSRGLAMGTDALASGDESIAVARGAQATATNAVSVGPYAEAIAAQTVACGYQATASAEGATVMGSGATASGVGAVALGSNTLSSGIASVAIGGGSVTGAQATADYSIAVGSYTNASHEQSICLGNGASSTAPNELTIAAGADTFRTLFDTSGTSGAISTYMIVNVNGTDYKIALRAQS